MNFAKLIKFLPLMLDIFKLKHLDNMVLLQCDESKTTIIEMQKIFLKHNFQIAIWDKAHNESYVTPYYSKNAGIFLNGFCNRWSEILEFYFEDLVSIQTQFSWFILSDDISSVIKKLAQYYIYFNSDINIVNQDNNTFDIYEVYNLGGVFKVNKVGYWDSMLHMDVKPRWDLTGVTINCPVVVPSTETIENETFQHYMVNKNHVDALHKLKFFAVLIYLRDMFNYSYDFKRVNSWGYVRNGSFDGMVGALQRRNGDLGGSTAFLRMDRAKFVDYIAETWTARQCFIFRHPKHPGGFASIYTRPLTARVWYCVLGMLAITAAILCLMLKLRATNRRDSSTSLALLFTWSANCQQGMTIEGTSLSQRMMIFVTFVYALTLYQYYNAAVVSTLIRELPKNIKTLEDLLRSNLKAGAEDILYTKDYFKRTTDPIALQLYRKKIAADSHHNFYTAEAGMDLVRKGGFAFHVDSVVAYRIMRKTFAERDICEVCEIHLYPPQKMAVVVRKGFPYKEQIVYGIRKLFEAGIMTRLKSVWDEPKPPCVSTPDSSVISVSIREFSMALIVLASGMVVAVVVLIGEIVAYRARGRVIKFAH